MLSKFQTMQLIHARLRIYQWLPIRTSLLITTNPLAGFPSPTKRPTPSTLAGEQHLTNIRQLTFGGENAEAYFFRMGQRLSFNLLAGSLRPTRYL